MLPDDASISYILSFMDQNDLMVSKPVVMHVAMHRSSMEVVTSKSQVVDLAMK